MSTPKTMGVERENLRDTLLGKYLLTAFLSAKNRLKLQGDLTEDEYLEELLTNYYERYQFHLASKVHPVNARELAIEAVTKDFEAMDDLDPVEAGKTISEVEKEWPLTI